ncbi:MAG: DUF2231 domain-containing protein [Candidatus Limnocylindrales bacterium]|jgi:nitrite reductase/ring-hydroxylating ferredoxin subunit/uncharacterized membrane protein
MASRVVVRVVRHVPGLDRLGRWVADVTDAFYRRARPLQSLLTGTWLGHPIHPMITGVAIGAWTVVAAFDAIGIAVPSAGLSGAAAVALWLGVAAAAVSVLSGLTDFKDTYGLEQRVGILHALVMACVTILFLASGIVRLSGPVDSLAGRALGFIGFGLMMVGGFLGGEMTFAFGSMVDHNAFREPLDDFVTIGPVSDLNEGLNYAEADGRPVLLVRHAELVTGIGEVCSHAGGPLHEGTLRGDEVTCPWHGSRFRTADGSVGRGPAPFPQARYEVRVVAGKVQVRSWVG